jgi:hypothetical protein
MRPNRTAELANGEFGADGLQDSPKFALRGRCTDFGKGEPADIPRQAWTTKILCENSRLAGGEGGIRNHGTVTRTTVFEFYDSHADPCRSVTKRPLWFGIFAATIPFCYG